jgi:hypothetical protein
MCSFGLCLSTNLILNKTLPKYNNDQITTNDHQRCLKFQSTYRVIDKMYPKDIYILHLSLFSLKI